MPFTISTPPDWTEGLPFDIGQAGTGQTGADVGNTANWDVSFGSLGFHLRPSEQYPYERGPEPVRKQQIDTSDEAGEQSFGDGWWRRAQSTWDNGAGINWYEPGVDPDTAGRFKQSQGVDVWSPGEFSLLRTVVPVDSTTGSIGYSCTFDLAGDDGFVEWRGETARRFTVLDPTTPADTGSTGGSGTIFTQPIVVGGSSYAGSNSGVWRFTPGDSSLDHILLSSGSVRVWWAKERFFVASGPDILTAPLTSAGTDLDGETPLYTHSDEDWIWTGCIEASGAVLMSGYSGKHSAIYRFPLGVDLSDNPVILPGSVVQYMPDGEVIWSMGAYLGTALVLGTSSGVRIGQLNSSGDVQVGPLTITTPSPVKDVIFRDRFAWVTYTAAHVDGSSGAARIDLSAPVGDSGRYAWASDAILLGEDNDIVETLAMLGDRLVLTTSEGTWLQSATRYVDQGFLESGRIRYGTTEYKAFRLIRVASVTNSGEVIVSAITDTDTEAGIVTMSDAFVSTSDLPILIPQKALMPHMSVRIYLNASDDGESTPTVTSYVLKAAPASGRVRLYRYPLSIFDQETDRWGVAYSSNAYERLLALESLEKTAAPVRITDYRMRETYIGQIDSVNFTSVSPPDKQSSGFGGVATVVVRRLD